MSARECVAHDLFISLLDLFLSLSLSSLDYSSCTSSFVHGLLNQWPVESNVGQRTLHQSECRSSVCRAQRISSFIHSFIPVRKKLSFHRLILSMIKVFFSFSTSDRTSSMLFLLASLSLPHRSCHTFRSLRSLAFALSWPEDFFSSSYDPFIFDVCCAIQPLGFLSIAWFSTRNIFETIDRFCSTRSLCIV